MGQFTPPSETPFSQSGSKSGRPARSPQAKPPSGEHPEPTPGPVRDAYYENLVAGLSQELAQLRADNARLGQEVTQLRTQSRPRFPLQFPGLPAAKTFLPQNLSQLRLGFLLVLLSTIALSVHNVVVRIIGNSSTLLGAVKLGGYLQLGMGNSVLILWYRMFFVLLLMLPVATILYPSVWTDLKQFFRAKDRQPLMTVVASGACLFLSQILIYVAIGAIGPSVAVTIFFMYPILTVPMAWALFKDRPTPLRWAVMGVISLGVILTALPSLKLAAISGAGVTTAIASGVAFAFYLIFTQLGFRTLHPVPGSLVQFFTIFILASAILIVCDPQQLGVRVMNVPGFAIGGIVLSLLTLVGYLANNFGVRWMGAARASIVASSGPVMTAVLAFLLIQVPLQWVQILGILLVTGGVTGLSLEKVRKV
jgi:drug/metabolite transporter (DMT)-like permease